MALTFREQQDQVLDITKSAVYTDRRRVKRVIVDVGLELIQRLLNPVKSSAVVPLTNNVADYDLTASPFAITDLIGLRDVLYSQSGTGPTNTLRQVTPHEIYNARNQIYSGFLYAFALQGVSTLMLAPSPSTGDTIQLVYNYRPVAPSTDSDTWSSLLLDEDVDAIIVGAAMRVARWKAPALSQQLLQEYNRLVDQAQARVNRRGGSADRKMRLRTRRTRPHDNSTDTGSWY